MSKRPLLVVVTTRLFSADVVKIRTIARAKGLGYQTELRLIVRRALRGELLDPREIVLVRESR